MNWGDLTDIRRAVPQRFNVDGDAIGLAPIMGKAFEHAHDDTTEIDTNTIDASRLSLTASNMQNVLVGLARQIDAGQVDAASVAAPAMGLTVAQIAKSLKEKAERSYRDQLLLMTLQRYEARIAWHEDQIELIESDKSAIEDYLGDLESGKAPELNEDGSLKDAELEAKISAYEDKYGIKVDRDDPDSIRDLLDRMDGEIAMHERDIEEAKVERDAEVERISKMPEEQCLEELQKIEANKGAPSADAVTAKLDDEIQVAAVKGQKLDESTTDYASQRAIATNQDALFSDEFSIGSQRSGDLSLTFANAAEDNLAPNQPQNEVALDNKATPSTVSINGMNA